MRTLKESLLDDFGSQAEDLRKERIKDWVKKNNKYTGTNPEINPDGTINIRYFVYKGSGNFPDYIQFDKCTGDFLIEECEMTSLKGCPRWVGMDFDCSNNKIETLEGCPEEVKGDFDCSNNLLTSLKGCPRWIEGCFDCSGNKLRSLKGGPERAYVFICDKNELTTLEGCPQQVISSFSCGNNNLKNLKGCPKKIDGLFDCSNNPIPEEEKRWAEKNIKCDRFIW